MQRRTWMTSGLVTTLVLGSLLTGYAWFAEEYKSGIPWPEPEIIDPGPTDDSPPSDAIVLFGGEDLSAWNGGDKWIIKDGYAIANGGGITTKESFGDIQLHVEWATPEEVKGSGQGRGNSGIYLMNRYEVQVLDSYDNTTYYDGQAGSIYKQWPPMVNASRKPGEWQSYDILFTAPRFQEDGKLLRPAYVTVLHNGVVIQNHTEIQGTTSYTEPPMYKAHSEKGPIQIQFHGNPVRFRNIWLREIKEIRPVQKTEEQPNAETQPEERKPEDKKTEEKKPEETKSDN